MSKALTKVQLSELKRLGEEAAAAFKQAGSPLGPTLAGMSLSDGGREKISDLLNTFFEDFQKAAQDLPKEFSPSISPDTLANVDSTASLYLFADLFRHRGGWSLSSKTRALNREYDDEMDRRAWMAALYLKQVRLFLNIQTGARS